MKRRRLLIGSILVIAVGCLFGLPSVYWRVTGWWKGEAFYQGRPTSYWVEETKEFTAGAVLTEAGVVVLLEEPATEPVWFLDWLLDRLGLFERSIHYPPFEHAPAAVPVLLEMLDHPDPPVRRMAVYGLAEAAKQGTELTQSIGALRRVQRDEDKTVRLLAEHALLHALTAVQE